MKGKLSADSGCVNCKGVDFIETKEAEALEPGDWSGGEGPLKNLHYSLIRTIQTQTPAALWTHPFWEIEAAQLRSSNYVFWSKAPGFKPRLPHVCYETSQAGCITPLAAVLLCKAETRNINFKDLFGGTKLDTCKPFGTLSGASISNQWNLLLSFFLHKLKVTLETYQAVLLLCSVNHGTLWISDTSI